ncbi:MAG: protein-L-isoaspartate(D-aspartate) O-methyltransferase [Acidobacteria bacterium]|nr:protein-L-isoaspartate(D-aspartate) O-methyltransferase [Acidobacteriota bacterium]
MVEDQIKKRGVEEKNVLKAMEEVPRHKFVAADEIDQAYKDCPVSIGWGQNMYQPYIVARMTELLDLHGDERVLEIGTGSGYHSAVLSRVAKKVYSIEINDQLARTARRTLASLGYDNVEVRTGDGYLGWPEEAPFDAIILTAAPPEVPKALIDQLKVGGRMVVPVGGFLQDLLEITKGADGKISRRTIEPVRVTPMTGQAQRQR